MGLIGCGGGGSDSFSVDDRDYDTSHCPTGDDANACPGVSDFEIVPNAAEREYLVVWRARYGPEPESESLYGRSFDARSGEPRTDPVRLFGPVRGSVVFVTTFEPESRQYVVASQGAADEPGRPQPPVELRRFSLKLRPATRVRRLGEWQLADLVAEPSGYVAVVGIEHDQVWGRPSEHPVRPVSLRVETLDARGDSVGIVRRSAGRSGRVSLGARAVFDPDDGRLLVVWRPAARPVEGGRFRFESIPGPPGGAGAAPLGATGHSAPWLELTCNPRRRDCLIVYPGPRVAGFLDMRGQLFDGRGKTPARPFRMAIGTRGPIGAGPSGPGYEVSWYSGPIHGPSTANVVDAKLTSAANLAVADRYEVPGEARIATEPTSRTRLLAWKVPREHNSAEIVARLRR
jgi:hypothetical protein